MRRPLLLPIAASLLVLGIANATETPERRSTLDDQRSVAVTVYNESLALVKEVRRVPLEAGLNRLALRDVSAQMRPETALLRNLTVPGSLGLLEQNFDYDLLTPGKLLEKSVGRTVRIVRTHPTTGLDTTETAEVLAAADGVVLKVGDRIETGIPGRIVFSDLPANLRDRPTLVSQFISKQGGTQEIELSYLTGGLSWKADYVAELSADDSRIDLNGWVTLNNQSGTAYTNAKLQLVAGDVNRVQEELDPALYKMKEARVMAAAPAPRMVEESLFEYHLYTLQRPTTLANNQIKQVALMGATGVPVKKEFLLAGASHYYSNAVGNTGSKLKVGVFVEFANREQAGLGMPLPKGVVRVYKRDSAGNPQFVGEDRVDHTPRNETLRLKLGDAFDVTAERKQTDFRRREPTNRASYVHESAYEITLRNARNEAVTVTVREPVPGDWSMLDESHKHVKVAAGTPEWKLNVPANGSTTLKYRVLARY